MTSTDLIGFASQAMLLVLYLSLPVVVTATLIGLIVGLLQALTQVQEQTIAFGVKLVGVIVVLILTVDWMGMQLVRYYENIFLTIFRY
ncbi:MAG: type III secretion system export apparatus subunit SctS [Thiotrichales bacterium]